MPKPRVKPKSKSKTKLKPKTPSKTKLKTKTKSSAKPKLKSRAIKVKSKAKTIKVKSKGKPKTKAKAKTRARVKRKVKTTKTKLKSKTKPGRQARRKFTETQKAKLLEMIKKIVDLRKKTIDGLKSLDAIDHILDPYNQKYTDTQGKFDAIINFAMLEHAHYVADSGLIAFKDTSKDSIALYALLAEIGEGKAQFSNASDKMNSIYEDSLKKMS